MTVRELFDLVAQGMQAAREKIGCDELTISTEGLGLFTVTIDGEEESAVTDTDLAQAVVSAAAAWGAAGEGTWGSPPAIALRGGEDARPPD